MAKKTEKQQRIEELEARKAAAEQAAGDAATTVGELQNEMREKINKGRGERDMILAERFKNQERRDELAKLLTFEDPDVPADNPLRAEIERRYQDLKTADEVLETQFKTKDQEVQDLHLDFSSRIDEAKKRHGRAERDKFAADQRLQELQSQDSGGQSQ